MSPIADLAPEPLSPLPADPDFLHLKAAYLRFVVPVLAAFLAWFITYILCSAYARGFMAVKVAGNINVALVFGVTQFAATFAVTAAFARYARTKLDPLAQRVREGRVEA